MTYTLSLIVLIAILTAGSIHSLTEARPRPRYHRCYLCRDPFPRPHMTEVHTATAIGRPTSRRLICNDCHATAWPWS